MESPWLPLWLTKEIHKTYLLCAVIGRASFSQNRVTAGVIFFLFGYEDLDMSCFHKAFFRLKLRYSCFYHCTEILKQFSIYEICFGNVGAWRSIE